MGITDISAAQTGEKYNLIPKIGLDSVSLKLCVTYANGYIHYHNYADVHPLLFSPEGDKLMLTVAYSPPVIFAGRNLLMLEKNLSGNRLPALIVYREDYHEVVTDNTAPVITAAYYTATDKETGGVSIREALPDIPELPEEIAGVVSELEEKEFIV